MGSNGGGQQCPPWAGPSVGVAMSGQAWPDVAAGWLLAPWWTLPRLGHKASISYCRRRSGPRALPRCLSQVGWGPNRIVEACPHRSAGVAQKDHLNITDSLPGKGLHPVRPARADHVAMPMPRTWTPQVSQGPAWASGGAGPNPVAAFWHNPVVLAAILRPKAIEVPWTKAPSAHHLPYSCGPCQSPSASSRPGVSILT